jgi:hypothetical protein
MSEKELNADLVDTNWELKYSLGDKEYIRHLTFLKDGLFKYKDLKGFNVTGRYIGGWDKHDGYKYKWELIGSQIKMSYNNGFLIFTGSFNDRFDEMNGNLQNKLGNKATWEGKLIDSEN